jgi:hypothetical protein
VKVNEITVADLKDYAHVYHAEDDALFGNILTACTAYVQAYTGLTTDQLNAHDDLSMCVFVLSNELYDNRTFIVDNEKVNMVIKTILNMHSVNLL